MNSRKAVVINRLHVSSTNVFCQRGHLLETGLIEHMVQSASAPGTVFGEIRKFTLNFLPKIEETVETSVKVISESKGSLLINAISRVEGQVAASCQMKFIITEKQ